MDRGAEPLGEEGTSQGAQQGRIRLPPQQTQDTRVPSLGQQETATHASAPAWRSPRTEGPGSYSPWSCEQRGATKQSAHRINEGPGGAGEKGKGRDSGGKVPRSAHSAPRRPDPRSPLGSCSNKQAFRPSS